MTEALVAAGLACIIAAIVGGRLKAPGFEFPPLRSRPRQLLLGGVGVVLLVIAFVRPGPPPPPPPPTPRPTAIPSILGGDPRITLSANVGVPGTSLGVSGEGFGPGESVPIFFRTVELGRATADGLGSFSPQTVVIPQDWAFNGQFEITATGQSSIRRATAPFAVLAPRIEVTPAEGPPGTTVTVSGTGFAVDENVSITLHLDQLAEIKTNSDGSFSAKVQIPGDWKFRDQQFDISARGETSRRTDRTPFKVS